MAEYIERGAALQEIERREALAVGDKCVSIDAMKSFIKNRPAADVAQVVHGEWILRHIGAGHYWECSVCHTNPCIYVTEHTKFCPNCGAKMDGGVEDAEG